MQKLKFILSKNRALFTIIALILFTAFLGGYFYQSFNRETATKDSPNVILISIDTLRADHLGAYGYKRATSPNIDEFAQKSTFFQNAFTPVPCTSPSYASLFTGLDPALHKSYSTPLDPKFLTLASNFQKSGYQTAGIISNALLSNKIGGLGRGFRTYNEIDKKDLRAGQDNAYGFDGYKYSFQRGSRTTEEASSWLKKNGKGKFFLYVQYIDPHLPYGEEAPFKDKFVTGDKGNPLSDPDKQKDIMNKGVANSTDTAYLKDKYDEDIAYVDAQVGKLLDQLKSQGLYQNSIIIITADHGESFENNTLGHCQRLYDPTIKIPLIIYDPKFNESDGKKVKDLASLVDIYPTLQERLGLDQTAYKLSGISLLPTLKGQTLNRLAIHSITSPSHGRMVGVNEGGNGFIGQLYGLVTEKYRVIYNENSGVRTAYDITKDPGEINNIYPEKDTGELFERLLLWVNQEPLPKIQNYYNSVRFNQTLKGLGYLN